MGQGSLTTRTLPGQSGYDKTLSYQGVRFVMEESDNRVQEEVIRREIDVTEEEKDDTKT